MLPEPITREEKYLARIAGANTTVPEPKTRYEQYLSAWASGAKPSYKGYWIEFSAPEEFEIKTEEQNWGGKIEFSYDGEEWTNWDGSTIAGTKIYMRGIRNRSINGVWEITGSDVSCNGNIENLLNYKMVANGEHPPMNALCYYYMFYACDALIAAPSLPAQILTGRCYQGMFHSCKNLVTAPALPAEELADQCYSQMYYGCSKLKIAPALPAMRLAAQCYAYMFRETGIEEAPLLPAVIMAENCYEDMFADSALRKPPALAATTLADYCYYEMFYGCSALEYLPSLPATRLADYCYCKMFNGCGANLALQSSSAYPYEFKITADAVGTGSTQEMFTPGEVSTPQANTMYYANRETV